MLSFLSTTAAVTLPTAAPPFRLPMLPFDYADAMLPKNIVPDFARSELDRALLERDMRGVQI